MPVAFETRPLELAAERAVEVGARLLCDGRDRVQVVYGKGDRDFVTDVDISIERAMRATLHDAAPEIGFLGEEEGAAVGDGPAWVLDPIDGTINFSRDSPLCAISLALVVAGQPVLGVVDAPFLGERYRARAGHGAWSNTGRMLVRDPHGLREAIVGLSDFKVGRGSAAENQIHLALIKQLATRSLRVRMHGSAALDLAWLAAGRLNATAMLSNLPWDVTAGLLIVREAGGCVFDVDGTDHDSGSRFTLASVPSLKGDLCDLVQAATTRSPPP